MKRIHYGFSVLIAIVLFGNSYIQAKQGCWPPLFKCPHAHYCQGGFCEPGCQTNQNCTKKGHRHCYKGECVACIKSKHCKSKHCHKKKCVACTKNSHCPLEKVCSNYKCVTGCDSDKKCDAKKGHICDAKTKKCRPGCTSDKGCAAGKICTNNTCVTGCRADSACSKGKICTGKKCVTGCRNDKACPMEHICKGNKCVRGCKNAQKCNPNPPHNHLLCTKGQCATKPCNKTVDCPKGYGCYEDYCQKD